MKPVCSRCNDTHRMDLTWGESGDTRKVLCTSCPTPCSLCRKDGNGAFCAYTPCRCRCHAPDESAPEKREVLLARAKMIAEANGLLMKLLDTVCPMCASGDVLYCEVVDGQHAHVSGVCKGSPIRELMNHMDDVRDQFASEYNENEEPRCLWGIRWISAMGI